MNFHILKLHEKYWNDVMSGRKTFELRKNDRDFKVGDRIHFLKVVDGIAVKGMAQDVNGNIFRITYILKKAPQYGLDPNYCILGIKEVER